VSDEVYDVLNNRTSEKNGATPTTEAAAGNVTRSARAGIANARDRSERMGFLMIGLPGWAV
jgi:hypothetical protein